MRGVIPVLFIVAATAQVMDRVAVAVGNHPIKQSELERDVRLTDFLNGAKLDLSPAERHKSANRLIDQYIISTDIAKAQFPQPSAADVDSVLNKVKSARFPNDAQYRQALKDYGIAESDLKTELAWQLTVIRFIDARFEPHVEVKPARNQVEQAQIEERVNQAFFTWLDQARRRMHFEFHDEAFR